MIKRITLLLLLLFSCSGCLILAGTITYVTLKYKRNHDSNIAMAVVPATCGQIEEISREILEQKTRLVESHNGVACFELEADVDGRVLKIVVRQRTLKSSFVVAEATPNKDGEYVLDLLPVKFIALLCDRLGVEYELKEYDKDELPAAMDPPKE